MQGALLGWQVERLVVQLLFLLPAVQLLLRFVLTLR